MLRLHALCGQNKACPAPFTQDLFSPQNKYIYIFATDTYTYTHTLTQSQSNANHILALLIVLENAPIDWQFGGRICCSAIAVELNERWACDGWHLNRISGRANEDLKRFVLSMVGRCNLIFFLSRVEEISSLSGDECGWCEMCWLIAIWHLFKVWVNNFHI